MLVIMKVELQVFLILEHSAWVIDTECKFILLKLQIFSTITMIIEISEQASPWPRDNRAVKRSIWWIPWQINYFWAYDVIRWDQIHGPIFIVTVCLPIVQGADRIKTINVLIV